MRQVLVVTPTPGMAALLAANAVLADSAEETTFDQVGSAAEAWAHLDGAPQRWPDLLVIAETLPDANGLALAWRLGMGPGGVNRPVVILGDSPHPALPDTARAIGIADWITFDADRRTFVRHG